MPKKSGFTLIELLVTISIISILSVIGLVVYSSVLKQGRDSRRQSDLRSIQSALEQYYADNFVYPVSNYSGVCINGTLKFDCAFKSSDGSKTYLNKVPKDPTGSPKEYLYAGVTSASSLCDNAAPASNCIRYCLFAKLDSGNTDSATQLNADCYQADYNFVVTPP